MTKKPHKMTAGEKAFRKRIRDEMRAQGRLPPKKKPLNRKRFVEDARQEFVAANMGYLTGLYLSKAVGWTMSSARPTLEHVGVAKMLKVACAIQRFEQDIKTAKRTEYNESELYERLKYILDA